MKKCLIMFTLLLLAIISAAVTEKKQKIRVADDIDMSEKVGEDIAFEQTLPISMKDDKNE